MARRARAEPVERPSYDRFKEFGGRRYTGMKVGRGHQALRPPAQASLELHPPTRH